MSLSFIFCIVCVSISYTGRFYFCTFHTVFSFFSDTVSFSISLSLSFLRSSIVLIFHYVSSYSYIIMPPAVVFFIMSPVFIIFHHVSCCPYLSSYHLSLYCIMSPCFSACFQMSLYFIIFPVVLIYHHVFSSPFPYVHNCPYLSSCLQLSLLQNVDSCPFLHYVSSCPCLSSCLQLSLSFIMSPVILIK